MAFLPSVHAADTKPTLTGLPIAVFAVVSSSCEKDARKTKTISIHRTAMNNDLEQLRRTAKRLERYAQRVREKLWTRDRTKAIDALADTAETGESARRLYRQLQPSLHQT